MAYLNLFKHHRRIVFFGMLLNFFSSFGQTFFISISAPMLIATFGFSNTSWGTLYSAATLTSACCLPYLGKRLDDMPLKRFATLIGLGLAGACAALSVSPIPAVLLLALVGLRFFGQGSMGLTAATTMARAFVAQRGSALAASSIGFPIGEIILPAGVLLLIEAAGWRVSWMIFAVIVLCLLVPLIRYLLADESKLPEGILHPHVSRPQASEETEGWTRRQLLRDIRFYLLVPAYISPPFLATALILNQFLMAEEKGWSAAWIASSFMGFGVARLVFALINGPLIDRFSARKIFPFHLIPFVLGTFGIGLISEPYIAAIYYGMMGISMGVGSNTASALWAELYGVRHLGAIKGMMSTVGILSTAASPILFGWLLDRQVSFDTLFLGSGAAMILFSLMSGVACFQRSGKKLPV